MCRGAPAVPHPKLARLHPAELADLVEAASHREGKEIMAAVGGDEEVEADVFEGLEPGHQIEFAEERTDAEMAEVLARMESRRRGRPGQPSCRRSAGRTWLSCCRPSQRRRVRALLGYEPATAGGCDEPRLRLPFTRRRRKMRDPAGLHSRHRPRL